jgi:hypothetical protein
MFKALETFGEANSFFLCLALSNVDEYLTYETEYQAKALKEIKDAMFFYLETFQDMKGESASAEQFEDWTHNMGKGWTSVDTIIMTVCCFVFQIDLIAFIKGKTANGDVMWSTFRPMGEKHLQMLVEELCARQIFISTSDLLFLALYPIDLEKTIERYQTDCYIVKEVAPIFFHSDDGMGDIKTETINDTIGKTNTKISILEEKEDMSELSMEKDEVTQLSCIVDKCSSVQDISEQLDMLWNNFADLNRTMKKMQLAWAFCETDSNVAWYYCIMCFSKKPSFLKIFRGIYEYNSQNVTSTIRNHCFHKHSLIFSSFQKYCEGKKSKNY